MRTKREIEEGFKELDLPKFLILSSEEVEEKKKALATLAKYDSSPEEKLSKDQPSSLRATDSSGFRVLAAESHDRNRKVRDTDEMMKNLDPEGVHICERWWYHDIFITLPSTDARLKQYHKEDGIEMRSMWLVKCEGDDKPYRIIMDTSIEVFKMHTVELPEGVTE